ncbi:hypothetical protein HDU91_003357, partial [Kappamyces sp. JEL0680]
MGSAYDNIPKGGDTGFRRDWDKREYEEKARAREEERKKKAQEAGSKGEKRYIDLKTGALATAREDDLDLEANVNKSFVVTAQDE